MVCRVVCQSGLPGLSSKPNAVPASSCDAGSVGSSLPTHRTSCDAVPSHTGQEVKCFGQVSSGSLLGFVCIQHLRLNLMLSIPLTKRRTRDVAPGVLQL